MTYVYTPQIANECGVCKREFNFWSAKKTSWWRLSATIECPHCSTKLVWPPQIRSPWFKVKIFGVFFLLFLIIYFSESMSKYLAFFTVFSILILIYLFKRSLKLNGQNNIVLEKYGA